MALTPEQNQDFVLSGLRKLIELLSNTKLDSADGYAAVWGKDFTDFETMTRGWFTVVLHVTDDEAAADRVKAGLTSYFER